MCEEFWTVGNVAVAADRIAGLDMNLWFAAGGFDDLAVSYIERISVYSGEDQTDGMTK